MLPVEQLYEKGVELVKKSRGKLEIVSKISVANLEELSIVYTPGIAEPTRQVHKNKELQYEYTAKSTMLAVVTDGTAVLGLGNVGPEAAMVVMEGKGAMLKHYAGADPVPLCFSTDDPEEIIKSLCYLEPSFSFIFMEDISAPRCFYIEEELGKRLSIPVFHDDQHGTAIAVCAGITNIVRITKRDIASLRVVINGAGASGLATAKLLMELGIKDLTVCDKHGVIGKSDKDNPYQHAMGSCTNMRNVSTLQEAMVGADVFIGLSVGNVVSKEMVRSMAPEAVVFAMANPNPEILPPDALEAGARFVATGRFDYPNTVNNLLAFPGVVRGAMEVRARGISLGMKLAAVKAIAAFVRDEELNDKYILPNPLDPGLAASVAKTVAATARKEGLARI